MARQTERNSDSASPGFWSRALSIAVTGTLLCLFGAVVVGGIIGSRWLEHRAESLQGSEPQLGEIRFVWPVLPGASSSTTPAPSSSTPSRDASRDTWLHPAFQAELLDLAQHNLDIARSTFSQDPLRRVGESLAKSGWFDGPPRITRQWGGGIVIDGSWRTPAAVVRHGEKDLVVSWDGRLMPPVYEPGATNLRVITGTALPPPGNPDGTPDYVEAWPGEDIAASLELLSELMQRSWAGQVSGIDVSEYSKHGRLIIATSAHTRVVWGGRFGKPAIGEVASNAKLAHLEDNVRTTGRLDGGFPMIYVNQERRLVARPQDTETP